VERGVGGDVKVAGVLGGRAKTSYLPLRMVVGFKGQVIIRDVLPRGEPKGLVPVVMIEVDLVGPVARYGSEPIVEHDVVLHGDFAGV